MKKIAVTGENRVHFFIKSRETKKITQTVFFQEKAASKGCSAEAALFKVSPCLFFFFHEFFKKSEILRFRCQVPGIQLDGGRAYRKGRRSGGGGLFGWLVCVGCCRTNAGAACQLVIRLFAVTQPPPLFGILDQGPSVGGSAV
jgi:hypothetical protein